MTEYPIPVERYRGDQALTVICETCCAETVVDSDNVLSDGFYGCPADCGGLATFKYAEADRCPNCKKLGWFPEALSHHCCSRVCVLQWEYALSLKEHAA